MTPAEPTIPVVELVPCSVCGAQPRRNGRHGTGGVLCTGDNATVGRIHRFQTYGVDQAEADAAWNRQATPRTPEPTGDTREQVAREVLERHLGGLSLTAARRDRAIAAMLEFAALPPAWDAEVARLTKLVKANNDLARMNGDHRDQWRAKAVTSMEALERLRDATTAVLAFRANGGWFTNASGIVPAVDELAAALSASDGKEGVS